MGTFPQTRRLPSGSLPRSGVRLQLPRRSRECPRGADAQSPMPPGSRAPASWVNAMLAVGHQIRRCYQEPRMLASGVNALPPANRGNDVTAAGLRRVSCHEYTLAKPSRSSPLSREWPILCRSTSRSGRDLVISHEPRDLIRCDNDCDKGAICPEGHGYGHLLDSAQTNLRYVPWPAAARTSALGQPVRRRTCSPGRCPPAPPGRRFDPTAPRLAS